MLQRVSVAWRSVRTGAQPSFDSALHRSLRETFKVFAELVLAEQRGR